MSFTRRFNFNPGSTVISQIEGTVIIRLTPPAPITGVVEGRVGLAGEFQDATYGIAVSSSGEITSNPSAVDILSSSDQTNFLGGFDELIGNFGGDMGNGFVELANKSYTGLIVVPIDNVSPATLDSSSQPMHSYGNRFWRVLPTCISGTNPNPVVPVSAAVVSAGYQFQDGSAHRVRVSSAFSFGGQAAYTTGTDGSTTAAASATQQNFTSAGGNFVNLGVKVGDILVLGVISDATYGANANTYRVKSITSATVLVVEKLDASSFAFTTLTNQPWRLHVAASADSSGVAGLHLALVQTGGAGYLVPARPLDASIAIDAALTPTVAPPAATASSWDPLSGLTGRTNHNDGSGASSLGDAIIYDANIHAANAADTAQLDARYQAAIDAMNNVQPPASFIDIVLSARKSSTIRAKIKSHCLTATAQGLTRRGIISPSLSVQSTQAVIVNSDPGVGANRTERLDYSWPGVITSVPQAVGFSLAGADGSIVTDGTLDTTGDGWLASIESNLPPENNPGQAAPPVPQVLAPILGYQRGITPLQMNDYIALKAAGIAGLFNDPDTGWQIESGVTTSLTPAEVDIARARMADYIEDSIAVAMKPFTKLNQTTQLIDTELGEIIGFLEGLKSTNNPPAQRIVDYSVDPTNGQTQDLTAQGITVFIINVRLLQSQKNLVLQTNIGMGVVITTVVGGGQ